jgi:hypothetical protein
MMMSLSTPSVAGIPAGQDDVVFCPIDTNFASPPGAR